MALTQVSTGGVKDGTILNADINASAAIAGSKISPIFTSATEVQNSTFKITDSNPEILLAVPSGGLDSRILNDGSGNLIIGHGVNSDTPTTRLLMDSSGNVGIGTTPSQKLDISGNINTTGELRFDSATRRVFYRPGNNDMIFEAAANFFYMQDIANTAHKWFTNSGDVRFTIQADGKVGIATSSPQVQLDSGGASSNGLAGLTNSTFYTGYANSGGFGGIVAGAGANGNSPFIAASKDGNGNALSLFFQTDGTIRQTINGSGNVGIGTTSPSSKLHIAGTDDQDNFKVDVAGSEFVIHTDSTDGEISLRAQDGSGNNFAKHMTFFTHPGGSAAAERVRITSDGKIGIGGNTSPADLVHIGSTGTSYYRFRDLNSETIGCIIRKNTTSTYTALDFRNANGPSGTLTVSTQSVSLANASDYRLKENETVISDGITKIKQLIPRRFNFKKDPTNTLDGFFAHEVSEVVPEAVIGEKDAPIDEDGNGYQQLDATKLIPILTAGLKEAIAKVEALETEVAALKAS